MNFGSRMRKVTCPDGSSRYVYKNLDDAFPLELKTWFAGVEAQLRDLGPHEIGASAEFQKQVSGLLMELDEANRSVQAHFRALYSAYANNPCGLDKWYAESINKLIQTEFKLRFNKIIDSAQLIKNKLATHPTEQTEAANMVARVRKELKPLSAGEKAKREFQTALDDFRKWRTKR